MTDLENKLATALVEVKYKLKRNLHKTNDELVYTIDIALKEYYKEPIKKLRKEIKGE